jgi:hypothetical protein
MNRFSMFRNLVLLCTVSLGGCLAQNNGPNDLSQTDNEPRHAELVGVDGVETPVVAHSERNLAISGSTPLGGSQSGPQPEPWHGASGDPNGPQPEPWKPRTVAADPNDTDPASAAAPKP